MIMVRPIRKRIYSVDLKFVRDQVGRKGLRRVRANGQEAGLGCPIEVS